MVSLWSAILKAALRQAAKKHCNDQGYLFICMDGDDFLYFGAESEIRRKGTCEMEVCTDEVFVRANHLLRKLNMLDVKLDQLPKGAPLRVALEAEYEEMSKEYRMLLADIQSGEGLQGLFEGAGHVEGGA